MPGKISSDSTGVRSTPGTLTIAMFPRLVSATPPESVLNSGTASASSKLASQDRSAHLCRQLPMRPFLR